MNELKLDIRLYDKSGRVTNALSRALYFSVLSNGKIIPSFKKRPLILKWKVKTKIKYMRSVLLNIETIVFRYIEELEEKDSKARYEKYLKDISKEKILVSKAHLEFFNVIHKKNKKKNKKVDYWEIPVKKSSKLYSKSYQVRIGKPRMFVDKKGKFVDVKILLHDPIEVTAKSKSMKKILTQLFRPHFEKFYKDVEPGLTSKQFNVVARFTINQKKSDGQMAENGFGVIRWFGRDYRNLMNSLISDFTTTLKENGGLRYLLQNKFDTSFITGLHLFSTNGKIPQTIQTTDLKLKDLKNVFAPSAIA